jgi:DNA-binding transcriptional MerR regulator
VSGVTVDELARQAGTTGRNIRALQTQGLLPRPQIVGRTGFYGAEHLDRLRTVLRLQQEGFSLASIAALFRALETGLTLEDVLGLRRQLGDDAVDEFSDMFGGWPNIRDGQVVSVLPSHLFGLPAAS